LCAKGKSGHAICSYRGFLIISSNPPALSKYFFKRKPDEN